MATVLERVRRIVVDHFGVNEEQILPTASFMDDLAADSLDLLDIVVAIEEEFAGEYTRSGKPFEISDENAKNIVTVQDAVDYLISVGIKDS